MKIVAERSRYHRFSVYYEYDPAKVAFCKSLQDSFGWQRFSYNAEGSLRRWVFTDSLFVPVIAEMFPDVVIEPQVEEIVRHEQAWANERKKKDQVVDQIRTKIDTDFYVKGLKKEMYPYQRVGVEFLVASGGRAIIADAPGLGKTAQALAYINHMGYKRSLVVCPASVKFAWGVEVKKWTNLKSVVIDSKTDLAKIPPDVQVWICNYDILKKHYDQLVKIRFDAIVGDECVIPQTYIATQDGQKQVGDLKVGEMILTYNLKKKIYEYKPLLAVVKKPLFKELTQVGDLVCTSDHKIYNGEKFVEARIVKKTFPMGLPELRIGKSDEVLAGCLMGDGSLLQNNGHSNARLKIGNCLKNEDYIQMKCNVINELQGRELRKVWNWGYKPSFFFRADSLTNQRLTSFRDKTYKNGERIVDEEILNMMNVAGLAVWIQDDGSVNGGVTNIFTYRYGEEGNLKIKEWFERTHNVSPQIFKEKKKDGRVFYYLQFNVQDSLTIYKKIRDYIMPSMRYKFLSLEEKFNKIHTNVCQVCGQRMFGLHHKRQNSVWKQKYCDNCRANYGTGVTYLTNKGIKKPIPYDCVYDLEIQDNHNFFADGILVHNCQLIKSTQAIRTKAFRAISREIRSVVLLSGTPLLSRPSELFSLLNIIDMKTWNNWYEFARKYCAARQTRWGMDTSGASNIEELHARIKRYFIRRDKTEVLKELPPKTFIDVPVELPADIDREYNTAANDLATYLRTYSGKQPPAIAKALAAEKLTQLNVLRQLNATGKVPVAIELIESVLDAGEKVLVFCSFIEPLETLRTHFKEKSVMLTGKTPVVERGDIVGKFQSDTSVQVFLGGIRSAGVGITLTAASNVIFLDYSWVPSDHLQAQDRAHRIGAKYESLNIYQLYTVGTIDEDLREMLEHKQGIFDAVIDGKVDESSSSLAMNAAIKRVLGDKS